MLVVQSTMSMKAWLSHVNSGFPQEFAALLLEPLSNSMWAPNFFPEPPTGLYRVKWIGQSLGLQP